MRGKIQDASYARLLAMLILSVIAFPILAELVNLAEVAGAPSRPDDVFSIQEQPIAPKKASPVKDDASVKPGGSSNLPENLPPEASHKSDKLRTVQFMPRPDFPEGAPPSLMERPLFLAGGPGFPLGSPPNFAPRKACLEDINRQMAISGYTKSKLQLTDNQKAAWKTVEDALDSANEKWRALCETLPNDVVGPPGMMERSEFLEKRLAARLDLVRSLKVPIQQLLGQLTFDQRASLDTPPLFPPF
jgi:LTXXQ motif family protein